MGPNMSNAVTFDEVAALAARLPPEEQKRLAEKIVRGLSSSELAKEAGRHTWSSLRAVAPYLLGGEDAQQWVTRSRRESDEGREKAWRQPGENR
jgi:hypothetical protein